MEKSQNHPKQIVYTGSGKIIGDFIAGDKVIGNKITGDQVRGNKIVNYNNSSNLAQAAQEIQDLIDRLAQTYPTDTRATKNAFADEIVRRIDANPSLTDRLLSATKAGGVAAIEQFLSHPAISFVVAALEDWEKTKQPRS